MASPQQRLIKKLDASLSKLIRENKKCYTCGKVAAHAGHFVRRGQMATRFDLHNIRPQCVRCNTFLYGNAPEYAFRLRKELGDKVFEELIKKSRQTKQWSVKDLETLLEATKYGISFYTETYNKLT